MTKPTIKYKLPQAQIDSVLSRMDLLEKAIIPTNVQKSHKSIWDSSTLLNEANPNGRWKPKPLQYPMVMDAESGEQVRADEIIKRYMGDSLSPLGGGIGLNQSMFNRMDALLVDNYFIGYAQLSLLTQNGILGRICGTLAEEMLRKGIEFVGVGDDLDEDKIKELEIEFERLNVMGIVKRLAYLTFVFGGALLAPVLKGGDVDDERENELFIDSVKVGKGDLLYLQTIEPTWYVPIQYNTTDPFSQWFYKPEYYTVIGQITHESRVFKCIYNEAVNLLKPVYLFNGIPLMQQCIPYVMKFESMYDEIIKIIQAYNVSVLKTNIEALIDDGNDGLVEQAANNLKNRLQVFNAFRNNMGTLAIANEEEFQQLSLTVGGLDVMLNQALELIAIIPGIPTSKLFGHSPRGFNSTGESEMKDFYDRIASLQNDMLRDIIIKVMHLAMLNIWGEIDDKITFNFGKLEESNKVEDSTIRLNDANADSILLAAGVLTPYDVRMRIANDPDSGYDSLECEEQDLANEVSTEFKETPELGEDPNNGPQGNKAK